MTASTSGTSSCGKDTPALIASLLLQARRHETPCGDGAVVWRSWGQGPRQLVLLHGGAGSWAHWARNITGLSRHYRLWCPDLPGMGESALPPDPWTPRTIAALLDEGLMQLAGEDATASLLGFSFGGMVAGHWAALAPGRIARVVTSAAAGTGMATPPLEAMRSWRRVEDVLARREIHRQNLQAWMLHDPHSADALAAWIAQHSVESDRLRNREVSRTDSLLRAMPGVRCPAHAICGRQDALFLAVQPQLEQLMLGAGFDSLDWIEGAGHWAPFERPSEFNALALRLLEG